MYILSVRKINLDGDDEIVEVGGLLDAQYIVVRVREIMNPSTLQAYNPQVKRMADDELVIITKRLISRAGIRQPKGSRDHTLWGYRFAPGVGSTMEPIYRSLGPLV